MSDKRRTKLTGRFDFTDQEPSMTVIFAVFEQDPTTLRYPIDIMTEFDGHEIRASYEMDAVAMLRHTEMDFRRRVMKLAVQAVKDHVAQQREKN